MEYKNLGRSGLSVSRLCLGTMNFGPHTDESQSHAILDRALELGINFIDTANVYGWKMGEGITEQIIGHWFAKGNKRREQVVFATKVYGMREVSGPIIAIALVLIAVFVPLAFISGLTGQFYKQFALTIAISTVISAINSLTLSPALSALLLKPHGAPKDALTRLMDRLFGRGFAVFNRVFDRGGRAYGNGVGRMIGRKARAALGAAGEQVRKLGQLDGHRLTVLDLPALLRRPAAPAEEGRVHGEGA